MKHDAVRDYLRRVRRYMACDWGTRRMLLSRLEEDMRGRDRPEDDLEELIARVGEPQFVAGELMNAAPPRPVRFGKNEFRVTLVALSILLALWCGFLAWNAMVFFHDQGGNIIVYEAKTISRNGVYCYEEGDYLP
ncbi:MAG: hypothetical protein ACSW8F_06345 [bacterium]